MRAADGALEKLCRERPEEFTRFTERLLTDVAAIEQPSVQWHLAQMLGEIQMTEQQRRRAAGVLVRQLDPSNDWIVVNLTLETLAPFVETGDLQVATSVGCWTLRRRSAAIRPCPRAEAHDFVAVILQASRYRFSAASRRRVSSRKARSAIGSSTGASQRGRQRKLIV